MTGAVVTILNMSAAGGILILAVLLLRVLPLRAPKWTRLLLWALVAARLALPFFVESELSLIPRQAELTNETVASIEARPASPAVTAAPVPTAAPAASAVPAETGSPAVSAPPRTSDPVSWQGSAEAPSAPKSPGLSGIAFAVWLAGAALMLGYAALSYLRLKKRLGTAVRLEGNVYETEAAETPFLLGLIRPAIYLPFGMDERSRELVLLHERAHIRSGDQAAKLFGYVLLAVHWFNPLVWLAYALFSQDIELCCDERVISSLTPGERADYSEALLRLSLGRRRISACPLAFGEANAKTRVKSILNYKKPVFWMIVAALLAAAALAVFFLTSPKKAARYCTPHEAFGLARENGWVAVSNLEYVTGEDVWNGFLEKTAAHEPSKVTIVTETNIVHFFEESVEPSEAPPSPAALFTEVKYDGEKYTVRHGTHPSRYSAASEYANLVSAQITYDGARVCIQYTLRTAAEPSLDSTRSNSDFKTLTLFTVHGEEEPEPTPKPTLSPTDDPMPDDDEKLSSLSDDEILTVLRDYGLTIPEEVENGTLDLRALVRAVEENPVEQLDPYPQAIDIFRYDVSWAAKRYTREIPAPARLPVSHMGCDGCVETLRSLGVHCGSEEAGDPFFCAVMLDADIDAANPYNYNDGQKFVLFEDVRAAIADYTGDEGDYPGWRIACWPIDFDGDGTDEYFRFDLDLIVNDFVSFAWVESADGRLLSHRFYCGSGHIAYCTLAVVNSPDHGLCLMQLGPEFYGEYYGYTLYALRDGEFGSIASEVFYNYDSKEGADNSFDPGDAARYEAEVNSLLASGRVLVSTDRCGVMNGELFAGSSDEPIAFGANEVSAVVCTVGCSDRAIESMRGAGAEEFLFVDEPLRCRISVRPYLGE